MRSYCALQLAPKVKRLTSAAAAVQAVLQRRASTSGTWKEVRADVETVPVLLHDQPPRKRWSSSG